MVQNECSKDCRTANPDNTVCDCPCQGQNHGTEEKVNKAVKKRPLWEARRVLGIKRAALRKRRESAEEMEAQVRLWEQKVRALEDQERAV